MAHSFYIHREHQIILSSDYYQLVLLNNNTKSIVLDFYPIPFHESYLDEIKEQCVYKYVSLAKLKTEQHK